MGCDLGNEWSTIVSLIDGIDPHENMHACGGVVGIRWAFDIDTDKETVASGKTHDKSDKEITKEIQAIMRQITSSVSFLPLLDFPCSFDLLVYTNADIAVPSAWEESDPRHLDKANQVKLRSFTTKARGLC